MKVELKWLSNQLVLATPASLASQGSILNPGRTEPELEAEVEPETTVSDQRDGMDGSVETTVIGIRSQDCFAIFDRDVDRRWSRNRDMLAFDLEAELPLEAERMALAVLESRAGSAALVADIEYCMAVHEELIENRQRIPVALLPLSWLVMPEIQRRMGSESRYYAITHFEGSLDLFEIDGGRICRWYWLGENWELVKDVVKHWSKEKKAVLFIFGTYAGLPEKSAELCQRSTLASPFCDDFECIFYELDLLNVARLAASEIATGHKRPPLNLLDDRPLRHVRKVMNGSSQRIAAWAFVGLLLSCSLALGYRSWSYRDATSKLMLEQEAIFTSLFPRERIPVGMAVRLRSEQRELLATRSSKAPLVLSMMPVLKSLLESIPDGLRVRIDRIVLQPTQIALLQGAVPSFSDIDQVTQALEQHGFVTRPASSSKIKDGVSLRLEQVEFRPQQSMLANGGRKDVP